MGIASQPEPSRDTPPVSPRSSVEHVYKVLRSAELASLVQAESFPGSADDRRDGFIHLSSAAQVAGTLSRHFAAETALWLAALPDDLDGMRFDPSRGGALSPHLYRPMATSDIAAIVPIPDRSRDEWCDNLPQFTPRLRAP